MKSKYPVVIIAIIIAAAVLPARLKADRPDPGPPQTVMLVADQWSCRGILVTMSSSSGGAPAFPCYSWNHPNEDQLVSYAEADAYLRGLGFRRASISDNQLSATYVK